MKRIIVAFCCLMLAGLPPVLAQDKGSAAKQQPRATKEQDAKQLERLKLCADAQPDQKGAKNENRGHAIQKCMQQGAQPGPARK
jgi:hypothetical protein